MNLLIALMFAACNLLFIAAVIIGYFQIVNNVDECRQSLKLIAYYEEKRFKAEEAARAPMGIPIEE